MGQRFVGSNTWLVLVWLLALGFTGGAIGSWLLNGIWVIWLVAPAIAMLVVANAYSISRVTRK